MSKDDFELMKRAYHQIMVKHSDCDGVYACTCLIIAEQIFMRVKELTNV